MVKTAAESRACLGVLLLSAGVLVTAFCFMLINLLVDILATLLDPRVRQ